MLALGSRSGKLGSQKHGLFGWSLAAAVWLNLVHFSLQSVCVCHPCHTPPWEPVVSHKFLPSLHF